MTTLVTDLFWPTRHRLANTVLETMLDEGQLAKRACQGLDPAAVRLSLPALAAFAGTRCWPHAHALNAHKGRSIGSLTRRLALRSDVAALCYTSYAFEAFRDDRARPAHRILFALQADPAAADRSCRTRWSAGRRPPPRSAREARVFAVGASVRAPRLRAAPGDRDSGEQHLCRVDIDRTRCRPRPVRVVPYGSRRACSGTPRPPQRRKPFRIADRADDAEQGIARPVRRGASAAVAHRRSAALRAQQRGAGIVPALRGSAFADANILGLSGPCAGRRPQDCDVLVLPSLAGIRPRGPRGPCRAACR